VCQASLFPFAWPSRSSRSGSASRPRAPSPPPLEKERLRWEDSINMNGHNDKFRTCIRRTLRDTLGFSQARSQDWAERFDYWIHKKVIDTTFIAARTGAWPAALCGAGAIAIDYREAYRAARYYYFSTEGIKKTLMGLVEDRLKSGLKRSLKWEEKHPELKFIWEE
jgi:hypothetical protein